MKKAIIMIVLALMVITGVITWVANTKSEITIQEVGMFGALILLVGFAVFIAIKKIKSAKAGLKSEDELSKKIMNMAAARSYYVSIYLWLFIMYLSDRTVLEIHSLIGLGIIGMAILFAGFWVFFNFRGKFNE